MSCCVLPILIGWCKSVLNSAGWATSCCTAVMFAFPHLTAYQYKLYRPNIFKLKCVLVMSICADCKLLHVIMQVGVHQFKYHLATTLFIASSYKAVLKMSQRNTDTLLLHIKQVCLFQQVCQNLQDNDMACL